MTRASAATSRSRCCRREFDADPDRIRRFEQEARAIAALNHPHICQIYDVGPGYLVLEFLDGAPLSGPLPPEEAMRAGRAGRRRPPCRSSEGHPPSRSQAGQHLHHERRPRQGARLRPGQGHDRGGGRHAHHRGRRGGHGRLHVARTGARARRSTRARTCSVWAQSSTRCSPAPARSAGDTSADVLSAVLRDDPPPFERAGQPSGTSCGGAWPSIRGSGLPRCSK